MIRTLATEPSSFQRVGPTASQELRPALWSRATKPRDRMSPASRRPYSRSRGSQGLLYYADQPIQWPICSSLADLRLAYRDYRTYNVVT